MNILVIGGTRLIGKHLVKNLISKGHDVTIANRGTTPDDFGNNVSRTVLERTSAESISQALGEKHYDMFTTAWRSAPMMLNVCLTC